MFHTLQGRIRRLFSGWVQRLQARWRTAAQPGVGAADRLAPAEAIAAERPQLPMHRYASVCIPALNEEKRIADVVAYAWADPATAEVIVIDDCSIDATAERARAAGARVVTSTMLGKGASNEGRCL